MKNKINFFNRAIFICLLCLSSPGLAQNDASESLSHYFSSQNLVRFADFLWKRSDYERAISEYQRHLFSAESYNDYYVYYQLGRCHFRLNQPQKSARYFKLASQYANRITLKDTLSAAYSVAIFFTRNNARIANVLDSLATEKNTPYLKNYLISLQALNHLQNKEWKKAASVVEPHNNDIDNKLFFSLRKLAEQGANLSRKSPAWGSFMSVLIPGSGRIYTNHLAEGLYSFFLISGSGWLAYEGFRDSGSSSFKGWMFGAISGFLHAGNIYGSFVSAKTFNQTLEKKILDDVQMHINYRISF